MTFSLVTVTTTTRCALSKIGNASATALDAGRLKSHATTTVSSENAPEFKQLIENRRHKVRDQVITIARMASLADFDQPQLADFRRRILLRLRRIMPELKIDDLYISDFQLEVRGI